MPKPATFGGHSYLQRTFIRDGVASARIYRPWTYGGRQYALYHYGKSTVTVRGGSVTRVSAKE